MFFQRREEPRQPEAPVSDVEALEARVESAGLPEHVLAAARKELSRLKRTDPSVAEYGVGLTYVDVLLGFPWNVSTPDDFSLEKAAQTLARRHSGLGQIRDRVLEYLAARCLSQSSDFHILVVDDEEIARANLKYVLGKEGYQVRTAANGQEALEEVRRFEFDCILTDLKMDKMDGMQLLEEARKLSPQTQVIMVTGYATVNTAVQAMRQGAAYYLAKPVNLNELRATVAEVVKTRSGPKAFRSPALCFAGPPGTGKTSVGQAMAESLGRKFYRLSLAGLRDESELKGHRRTYVGAMPGRIAGALIRLGVNNPVIMLDEMDKIGKDFRGDPASVFLEILDPEQNGQFLDNYLDLGVDLSQVLFIATVNDTAELSGPLLDRLEVVSFQGYSLREKLEIAQTHLIPRQLREHGLVHPFPVFTPEAVARIVEDYTREAGLRNLDREVASLCRKLARIRLEEAQKAQSEAEKVQDAPAKSKPRTQPAPMVVDEAMVIKLLGPRRFLRESAAGPGRVGVATGLVYSGYGGEIIFVEATSMKGHGTLTLTGSLGEILQESARAALSFVRSHASALGLDEDAFTSLDVHIHIPAAGIPKEGSSAGVTLAVALISLFSGRPARRDVAMTGEITLGGEVLPVGGVREKVMAAARAGVRKVLLPAGNAPEAGALDPDDYGGVEIVFVSTIAQALDGALEQTANP
ncbi:response regulator [Fundidesulfovibrio butyratiphilus]